MHQDEQFWREIVNLGSFLPPKGVQASFEGSNMLGRWCGQLDHSGPEVARSALRNLGTALEAAVVALERVVIPDEESGHYTYSQSKAGTEPTVTSSVASFGYHAKYFWIAVGVFGMRLTKADTEAQSLFAALFSAAASCFRGRDYAVSAELRLKGLALMIRKLGEQESSIVDTAPGYQERSDRLAG